MQSEHVRVLIVGSGPAGYTAAIYAARAGLEPVMLAGLLFGGQLMITTDVENYPGYPEAVTGPSMMEDFQKQAERFGAKLFFEDATRVDLSQRPFVVETDDRRFTADARRLGPCRATGQRQETLSRREDARAVPLGLLARADF